MTENDPDDDYAVWADFMLNDVVYFNNWVVREMIDDLKKELRERETDAKHES